MHRFFGILLVSTFLFGCGGKVPRVGESPVEAVPISIVGLNDLHGTIESRELKVAGGKNSVQVGGLEVMAAYFDAIRAKNPGGTLFVDSGDIYQGTLLSNWFQGRSLVQAYNALGIDASTFGNHEFDFGDSKKKMPGTAPDPQGALKVLLADAHFKVVSTNVHPQGATQFPGTVPSQIFVRNGVRIGVIGVTTVTTPSQSSPRTLVGLEFKALETAVEKEASRLRDDGAQLVILLSHAGGKCDMTLPPERGDEACKSSPADEMTQLLEQLPQGTVDLVMAGHTHFAQAHFIRGVPVVQTTGYGASFSYVQMWVNRGSDPKSPSSSRIARVELRKPTYFCHSHFEKYASCNPDEMVSGEPGKPVPAKFEGREIQPRKDLTTVLQPYALEVDRLRKKPLFKLKGELAYDRSKESATLNCVADIAGRAAFGGKIPENGLFLSHSGGIRTSLKPGADGVVNYGAFFAVLPFDESLVLVELSGEELDKYAAFLSTTPKSIAVLSEPWSIALGKMPVFPRFRELKTPAGARPEAKKNYMVATSEFNTLPGGPGDVIFAEPRRRGAIQVVGEALRDFLAESFEKGKANEVLPPSCTPGAALDRTALLD